jgi:prolyl oligopeptidase
MTTALELADPYEYLEDAADPRTIAWTAEQNDRTRAILDALPGRAALERRFDELLAIDALGVPVAAGGRVFFTARRGRSRQTVLYVREDGADRVLLDPADLDPNGLTALDWWYASPAGNRVAFGLSTNGDERSTLGVLDAETGERSGEAIPDTRYCSLAWFPDESGFYYTRYPAGADYDVRLYRHVLGAPWANDEKIFGDGRAAEDMLGVGLSADGRWLTVRASMGWTRSDVYLADTSHAPFAFRPLAEGRDAVFDVQPTNRTIYIRTNDGAPRFRLFALDPATSESNALDPNASDSNALDPKALAPLDPPTLQTPRLESGPLGIAAWQELVGEGTGVLDAFAVGRDAIALHLLEDVRSVVRVRRTDGSVETLLDGPDSSVLGISADERSDIFYILRSSFLDAPAVARVVAGRGNAPAETTIWERVATPFEPERYKVTQEWFASRDGTRIPMWVLARSDVPRNGTAPAVLYGYGGFDVSLGPSFAASLVPWLDAGGVYALANLRGGGEFGDAWHRAGMRENKQNVFDDFIAAAEYLAASGIASADRIAVSGGSNGGLLVAALATQRPELACAVVCAVPLTDMLRFHRFLIGRLWIAEYGDPESPQDAEFLRAYSPYHNVREGVAYPAMFIETAEADGRVDPSHAKKFGARVQAATSGSGPILVYVEPNAGHGAGKPRDKIVAELADRWGFLAWRLGQLLT